jgi:hypothetical protein
MPAGKRDRAAAKASQGISRMNGHAAKERGQIDSRHRSFLQRLCLFVVNSTARGMAAKKQKKHKMKNWDSFRSA